MKKLPKYKSPKLVYYGPHPCQKCDKKGKNRTIIVKAGNGAPDSFEYDYPLKDHEIQLQYPNTRPDWKWKRHKCPSPVEKK